LTAGFSLQSRALALGAFVVCGLWISGCDAGDDVAVSVPAKGRASDLKTPRRMQEKALTKLRKLGTTASDYVGP
jgi:hypothetical protein